MVFALDSQSIRVSERLHAQSPNERPLMHAWAWLATKWANAVTRRNVFSRIHHQSIDALILTMQWRVVGFYRNEFIQMAGGVTVYTVIDTVGEQNFPGKVNVNYLGVHNPICCWLLTVFRVVWHSISLSLSLAFCRQSLVPKYSIANGWPEN